MNRFIDIFHKAGVGAAVLGALLSPGPSAANGPRGKDVCRVAANGGYEIINTAKPSKPLYTNEKRASDVFGKLLFSDASYYDGTATNATGAKYSIRVVESKSRCYVNGPLYIDMRHFPLQPS